MTKAVLVIGGAGYIGSHIVKDLSASDAGFTPIVFDNLSTGYESNLLKTVPLIKGDILDEQALAKAMQDYNISAVIHLAAKKAVGESMTVPEKYSKNNLIGAINILNAMTKAGAKYFIFSSSAAVYGTPQTLPIDEQHPTDPINFYGFTKLEIERLLPWYDQLKGIKFMSLRYFNAVGYAEDGSIMGKERDPQNLFPIIMEVLNGTRDKLHIFGNDYDTKDGTCVRDYIHTCDLASAHTLALNKLEEGAPSAILNLGTSKGLSVLEIVKAAEKITGKPLPYEFTSRRAGDPAIIYANAAKARQVLGWTPTHSDLDNIISSMWKVYANA